MKNWDIARGVTKAAPALGLGTAGALSGFSTPAKLGLMLVGLVGYSFVTRVVIPIFDTLGTCLQEWLKRVFDRPRDRGS